MKYDIAAKETVYKGITFRSRLEATWAAMFDLLGWRWEYETDPLGPWLPDFQISAPYAPHECLLVEVKPTFALPKLDGGDFAKVWQAIRNTNHVALALGNGPLGWNDLSLTGYFGLGYIYDRFLALDGSLHAEIACAIIAKDDGGFGLTSHSSHGPPDYPRKEAPFDAWDFFAGPIWTTPWGSVEGRWIDKQTAEGLWGAAKRQVRYEPRCR